MNTLDPQLKQIETLHPPNQPLPFKQFLQNGVIVVGPINEDQIQRGTQHTFKVWTTQVFGGFGRFWGA